MSCVDLKAKPYWSQVRLALSAVIWWSAFTMMWRTWLSSESIIWMTIRMFGWRRHDLRNCLLILLLFLWRAASDKVIITEIFEKYKPQVVVNLAAQAGVRYSITNPDAYIESNLIGFYNILEACRYSYDGGATGVGHLVYASSSSVYGSNKKVTARMIR